MNNSKNYFFSIIIPVFNDSKNLEKNLEALARLNYPGHLYEIIVVDNNSPDDLEQLKKDFNEIIWLSESKQDPYAARNKGLTVARGEIIAFTDSDCIPSPDWLKEACATFKDSNIAAVAGEVDFYFRFKKPNIFEYVDSVRSIEQAEFVRRGFAATANFFVRKEMFSIIGVFNEKLFSGGDYEFGQRLTKLGHLLIFNKKAIVKHPARHNIKQLVKRAKRVSRGHKILMKMDVWHEDSSLFRLLLPRKTIPHNIYYNNFNFYEKVEIYIIFNILHYLGLFYRYL